MQKTELTGESEIDLYIEQLNDKFESLKLVDTKLEKVLNPQDVDKELQSAEEYQDIIVTWRFKANKYLRNLNQKRNIHEPQNPTNHPIPGVNFSHQTHSVKLPKITIPKFSGNIDLSNLDTLSIKDCSESHSKTETQELALNYLRETLDQDSTSRYKVNLSWLEGHPPLPDNKELARKKA
ncbi:integrase catalytic domain-containing protein [Trichonephila clavipes]|nr:integrase catalytic domain-containing protein [Trichonephila clavipes]